MNEAASLIDLAIRESLRPHGAMVPKTARDTLLHARKFVLDYSMSAYIADLTNAAFLANPARSKEMVDGARRLARLPHPITWIEYDCRARKIRSEEAYSKTQLKTSGYNFSPDEVIPRVGWLLVQHPKIETAFTLSEIVEIEDDGAAMLPYTYTWTSEDDVVLPWRNLPWSQNGATPSEVATGIIGYKNDHVGVMPSLSSPALEAEGFTGLAEIMRETVGELRAAWTLLATINDLPTTTDLVRPSKGYVARGKYRRFVEHTVIKLHVPAHRSLQTLAARAVATIRRRAHQVRGHWRKDWRHPGERLWIREHQRGDASLGVVVHDYAVSHDK